MYFIFVIVINTVLVLCIVEGHTNSLFSFTYQSVELERYVALLFIIPVFLIFIVKEKYTKIFTFASVASSKYIAV